MKLLIRRYGLIALNQVKSIVVLFTYIIFVRHLVKDFQQTNHSITLFCQRGLPLLEYGLALP